MKRVILPPKEIGDQEVLLNSFDQPDDDLILYYWFLRFEGLSFNIDDITKEDGLAWLDEFFNE